MMRKWILSVVLMAVMAVLAGGETRYEIQLPDIEGYKTLKCDFHSHTVFSDGQVWPTVRIQEAWREGLDAICITDHIEYQPHEKDIPTQHNRSYEIAKGLARDMDIILVKGSEITRPTPPGHYNALFINDSSLLAIGEGEENLKKVMEEVGRQGGFIFWNHHSWKGQENGQWSDLQTEMAEKGWLKGMEVANGPDYYPNAMNWCLEKNLVMMGNSDIHGPSLITNSNNAGHRSVTLVFARDRTHAALREAVYAGQTAVWCVDTIYGKEQWLKPLAEKCVRVSKPFYIKENTWGVYATNTTCLNLDLTRKGKIGPKQINIPAHGTVLAQMEVKDQTEEVTASYAFNNFWIGDNKPVVLEVSIDGLVKESN